MAGNTHGGLSDIPVLAAPAGRLLGSRGGRGAMGVIHGSIRVECVGSVRLMWISTGVTGHASREARADPT